MKTKKSIFILSTSKRKNISRSKLALKKMKEDLESLDIDQIEIVFYDLHEILNTTDGLNSSIGKQAIKDFQKADAWIIGTPIYNWQASPDLLSFLNTAIDSDKIKAFIPLILVGAGGSLSSITCLDGVIRGFTMELNALILGRPLIVTDAQIVQKNQLSDSFVIRYTKHLAQLLSILDIEI